MTEPNQPPQADEPAPFDAVTARPEQNEEQLKLAAEAEEYLHDVIDPELGINVVDLGLVYDIWVETEESGRSTVVVNMTLTSPACPLTDVIEDQALTAVVGNTSADNLVVNWVWMPPWGPHLITEDGREQLRALGFSV
ncbi:metal-sulfur cluster assembly factor [Corynebacterium uterequi]|uniref:Putative metal-sulfur cluster biosynthetic enzyme n=1 Tax=Corynebacterium uterequi TaxID=1072256 RepID=A0A0G3HGX3_9CORY|nr:metal-sulfur cluster assembly factor [Corynebacterium uterequi]AKK11143.1 putative metal-sulfur cluster biosynthetic enzyme [Corynebacterium uterequi]